jgi:hypothetical protein
MPGLCRASTSWPRGNKEGVDGRDKPGHDGEFRHCERTGRANAPPSSLRGDSDKAIHLSSLRAKEAIHLSAKQVWIASSLPLLAMTRSAILPDGQITSFLGPNICPGPPRKIFRFGRQAK